MAFEELHSSLARLMEEIEARPDDRHELQQKLWAKIKEIRSLGLPVPHHLLNLYSQLEQEEADDMFDNLPI